MTSKVPIERVVTILTPIFGAAAAWVTGIVAHNFPGLPAIPAGEVTALMIAGFTGAVAAAIHWLYGRRKFVAAEQSARASYDELLAKVRTDIAASPQAGIAIGDIENVLRSHTAQIEAAIDAHVPLAVGQSIKAMFAQLGQPQPAQPPVPAPQPPVQSPTPGGAA